MRGLPAQSPDAAEGRPAANGTGRRPMTAVRRLITSARISRSSTPKRSQYARSNASSESSRSKSVRGDRNGQHVRLPGELHVRLVLARSPSPPRRPRWRAAAAPPRPARPGSRAPRRRPCGSRSWLIVRTKSWRTSATRQPSAEVIPGRAGTSTFGMASSRASATAWRGPAPPNANRTKSRGSCPRWSDTSRMAPAILSLATRTMAAADGVGIEAEVGADLLVEDVAHAIELAPPPATPSSPPGFSRPRRRFASVMVGSSPPRP